VQFQQECPKGILRLPDWPVDVFQTIVPPSRQRATPYVAKDFVCRDMCEVGPFVWKGRLCLLECVRPATGGDRNDYYLLLRDVATGKEMARFAKGYGLASLIVHDDAIYAFASRWEADGWHDVTMFSSSDLKHWRRKVVVKGENEGVFNTSVCEGPDGFVMTYESNDPAYPPFTVKLARSADLQKWTKIPEATFGTNRYTACPCIRYANGYYYVLYLEHRTPRWRFETYITRSRDLKHWELSSANPVLAVDDIDEGINASDPDLVEFEGKTYLYYAVGDQLSWMNVKRVVYPGSLAKFLASWYKKPGIPDWGSVGMQEKGK
jgi:alpha-L-fucosidase